MDRLPKLHAACDQCRHRKLKCSSTTPPCARCAAESIHCNYSVQKPMGRPRKRQRGDDVETENAHPSMASGNAGLTPPEDVDIFGITATDFAGQEWNDNFGLGDCVMDPGLHDLDGGQAMITPPIDTGGLDSAAIVPSTHHSSQTSATNPSPSPLHSCACLSTMYLTITNLSAQNSLPFPCILPPLRAAITTAAQVLHCPTCPHRNSTAAQNLYQLASLLMTIVDFVSRVLHSIDADASEMEAKGSTKVFAMADASVPLALHTGTADCPARFDMHLGGQQWRTMVRSVIKAQVVGGEDDGGDGTLFAVVNSFSRRQEKWHSEPAFKAERMRMFGEDNVRRSDENKDFRICGKLVESVKMGVVKLGL